MIELHSFHQHINLDTRKFIIGQIDHFAPRISQNDHLPVGLKIDFYHIFSLTKPSRILFVLETTQNSHYFTHLSPILQLMQNGP